MGAGGSSREEQRRFDELFQGHHQAIHRYCLRRLGIADAEDAAAEVFAVAWRRLAQVPEGESGRAWLFGVAHKVVGNRYRSRRRQVKLVHRLEAIGTTGQATDAFEPPPSRQLRLLHRALDELGATDRELLRLAAWDRLSRSEIAYVLGIKENAVDQRVHRARTRLKERFDRLDAAVTVIEPEEAST